MSTDLQTDLAGTIAFAIKYQTFAPRKAKVSDQQIKINAQRIAEQILRSNFIILPGLPIFRTRRGQRRCPTLTSSTR